MNPRDENSNGRSDATSRNAATSRAADRPETPGLDGPRRPVLLIGLEAAEPSLVEQWCDEGRLPTLASLRAHGAYGRVLSTTEISSGATWPSVTTGTSPAKHGMGFYHRQLEVGTYRICKKYADQVGRDPFWLPLGRAGRRVTIFDVPETYPSPAFEGTMVVGWGAEALNWKQSSSPAALFREIERDFGRHPLAGWYQARPADVEGWQKLRSILLTGARARTEIALRLLARERCDLFAMAFAETHWAGHFFWHLFDERHPDHDPAAAEVGRDTILEVYQEVDRGLARLRAAVPDATCIVFSNTGMGPNYSGVHLVQEVLDRLGCGASSRSPARGKTTRGWLPGAKWGPYAVKRVENLVSPRRIEKVRRWFPERTWDAWTRRLLTAGNGWKDHLAFALPSDFTGAIRVNLRGREPAGRVSPGAECDALCDRITEGFLALTNPATGSTAVREVQRVRDLYAGDRIDELPDLIVRWVGDAPIDALTSTSVGTVSGSLPDKRSGAHQPFGFLLLAGADIRSTQIEGATIMDIAPTVLHLLGCPVDPDLDGRVLAEAWAPRPSVIGAADAPTAGD